MAGRAGAKKEAAQTVSYNPADVCFVLAAFQGGFSFFNQLVEEKFLFLAEIDFESFGCPFRGGTVVIAEE